MSASLKIVLSDGIKDFVEERVQSGDFHDASEYIADLVRRDQQARATARLEALLLEGIESDGAVPVTPGFWKQLRGDLAARRAVKSGPA